MPPPIRVLIVHNIMAPYRFPLFRALARESDIDLTVWFMSRSAKNRRWQEAFGDLGFKYDVLPSLEVSYFSRDLFAYILNYSFPWRFATGRFDVLISAGWLDFASQTGFLLAKLLRRKFILWSESTAFEPSWRRSLAAPLVRTMVRGSDAWISVGTRSRDYLCALGAQPASLFTAVSTVDVDHFRLASHAARTQREQRRAELGIRRAHVLLYCGQFIERKGLRMLLDAFACVKHAFADVALVMVGYGPLKGDLLATAASLGLGDDIHLLEHVEVDQMPGLYALGDVFVLPSLEETWGLVVNEAMTCALPVVVSDRVGSAPDLVCVGQNGFVFPAGDATALADHLVRLLTDDQLRASFGARSAEIIQSFTPEHAAKGFAEAIRHVKDSRTATEQPR